MYQNIIIGGGASGLVSAICLARKGESVLILEKNKIVGKKLLATGNGRCNISNKNINSLNFHSSNFSFIRESIKDFNFSKIESFFNSIGIILVELKDGKVYPMSLKASSVVDILEYEAKVLGVEICCNTLVKQTTKENDKFIVKTDDTTYRSKKLIIATGLEASSQLGGSSFGLDIASSFNHPIIKTLPSLVQLCSKEDYLKYLVGVKQDALVSLISNGEFISEIRGDILFTKYGVSGLAVLDISREVSLRLDNYEYCLLNIDLMPDINKNQLVQLLSSRLNNKSDKPILLWLEGFINKKLAKVIIDKSKIDSKVLKNLNKKDINKIVYTIKNLSLEINLTKGFDGAEVSAGGVDTRYINPKNMHSLLVNNLYFIGEILDVDGNRGGYNLHFAWLSELESLYEF
jgi:predicted Rossmann fold flavoprotein